MKTTSLRTTVYIKIMGSDHKLSSYNDDCSKVSFSSKDMDYCDFVGNKDKADDLVLRLEAVGFPVYKVETMISH